MLAADKANKQLVIGECKYRTSFNVSEVVENLKKKSGLVKGYNAYGFYIFSRYRIEESVTAAHPDVRFVSLENF